MQRMRAPLKWFGLNFIFIVDVATLNSSEVLRGRRRSLDEWMDGWMDGRMEVHTSNEINHLKLLCRMFDTYSAQLSS